MQEYQQLKSGLYIPPPGQEAKDRIHGTVESPLMQFLTLNLLDEWIFESDNYKTAWYSPVYFQMALIQQTTMLGVTLIQKSEDVPQSKGWTVTSMMARGIHLARLSCISLSLGSFSDAFSNYRMLLDRVMTLAYLDANDQYEDFAKAFYAEIYHRASKGINNKELRKNYSSAELKHAREMMKIIRDMYFNGTNPKEPGAYWNRPKSEELATKYIDKIFSRSDDVQPEVVLRIYDLGNGSVHPRLRDMIQTDESGLTFEDVISLTLITCAELSKFGLSLFEESFPLVSRIEEAVLYPPSGTFMPEILQAGQKADLDSINRANL